MTNFGVVSTRVIQNAKDPAGWMVDGILLTAQFRPLEGKSKDVFVGDVVLSLSAILSEDEEIVRIEAKVKDLSLDQYYVATPEAIGELCGKAFTDAVSINLEEALDEEIPLRQRILVS